MSNSKSIYISYEVDSYCYGSNIRPFLNLLVKQLYVTAILDNYVKSLTIRCYSRKSEAIASEFLGSIENNM